MKHLYFKPILIGLLCGGLMLLINLALIFGSVAVSDTGSPGEKEPAGNPLATPTPTRDDTGFLLLLLFVNYILAPALIFGAGAASVWLSPAGMLSLSRLLLVSALPGIVSMLTFTSAIVLFSLSGTAGANPESGLGFWLPAMAGYMLGGTIYSTAGGIIYGILSGRLGKNIAGGKT